MRTGIRLLLLVLVAAATARADVIVLKSGRRISATSVAEEGDRVYYETRAGRLSFPKSAVERIERGAFTESEPSGGGITAQPVDAPSMDLGEGAEDVVRGAVHDNAIDREYIARLERDARADDPAAAGRAAVAHHAAAQFNVAHGDLGQALDHYRRALTFAPEHVRLLVQISYLHLRRSEYSAALEYLKRGRRVAPDNADVAKLLGWAYRGTNQLDKAVEEWERALSKRYDPDVAAALEQVRRDQQEEKEYSEGESRHFTVRYNGKAAPGLAREILRTLERHFSAIESELNFTPPDSIAVILYTEQAFADITRAPGWVGALNDGRIRVPVEGLTFVDVELSRVLKHELTHSFIRQKTRERCPTWLNEGLAQWMEGKRSEEFGATLGELMEAKGALPTAVLEGSFLRLPGGTAEVAYAVSLAMVEYLVRTSGMSDIQRLLDRLSTEPSTTDALQSVYRVDYEELQKETAKFLRKTYGR